jgi:hypothetical protein
MTFAHLGDLGGWHLGVVSDVCRQSVGAPRAVTADQVLWLHALRRAVTPGHRRHCGRRSTQPSFMQNAQMRDDVYYVKY